MWFILTLGFLQIDSYYHHQKDLLNIHNALKFSNENTRLKMCINSVGSGRSCKGSCHKQPQKLPDTFLMTTPPFLCLLRFGSLRHRWRVEGGGVGREGGAPASCHLEREVEEALEQCSHLVGVRWERVVEEALELWVLRGMDVAEVDMVGAENLGIREGAGAGEGDRRPRGEEGRLRARLMARSSSTLKAPTGILLGATARESASSSPRRT